jgi:hypothetical protein
MKMFDTSFSLRAARSLTLPHQLQTEANDRSRVAAPISPAQAVPVAARAISRNALHPVSSPDAGVARRLGILFGSEGNMSRYLRCQENPNS